MEPKNVEKLTHKCVRQLIKYIRFLDFLVFVLFISYLKISNLLWFILSFQKILIFVANFILTLHFLKKYQNFRPYWASVHPRWLWFLYINCTFICLWLEASTPHQWNLPWQQVKMAAHLFLTFCHPLSFFLSYALSWHLISIECKVNDRGPLSVLMTAETLNPRTVSFYEPLKKWIWNIRDCMLNPFYLKTISSNSFDM